MEKSIDSYFTDILGVTYTNPREYSPLSLAYIGDSVFDLLIKTLAVTKDNKQAYKYHKEVSQKVKAEAQAGYIIYLLDNGLLTDDEEWIYKRGRNTKTHSTAKNATVGQYRMATGFECLIGYLYLDKQYDRMFEITKLILSMPDADDNKENAAEIHTGKKTETCSETDVDAAIETDKYEEDTVTVDGE